MSVPNQKKIIIHQSKQVPFLKIGIKELMDAYKKIQTPASFVLYLYLASNMDGFRLELSKEAFAHATGYSKSSYYRAVDHLTELGYIYEDNCGRLNFATKPKEGLRKATQNWESDDAKENQCKIKNESKQSQNCNTSISKLNTQIDNKEDKEEKRIIDKASQNDYSYLDQIVDKDDGSFTWKGVSGWIDGNDRLFFLQPKWIQVEEMLKKTPFNKEESLYILDNIMKEYQGKY